MSMLKTTFVTLQKTLARPSAEYADALTRCPTLAPYGTPAAALAALRPTSALSQRRRDALAATVLAEHQQSGAHVWPSILLVAFEPALVGFRHTLGAPGDADADQQVLLAFLEAARSVRGGTYTMLALRWLTEAKVKAYVKRETRERRHKEFVDDKHRTPFADQARASIAADEVMRVIEKRGGEELLRAVLVTEVEEDTLDGYVARTHARASTAERKAIYTRLRLAKARVLADLRDHAVRAAAHAA